MMDNCGWTNLCPHSHVKCDQQVYSWVHPINGKIKVILSWSDTLVCLRKWAESLEIDNVFFARPLAFTSVGHFQVFLGTPARISKHTIRSIERAWFFPFTPSFHFGQSIIWVAVGAPECSVPFPARVLCFTSIESIGYHDCLGPSTINCHVAPFTHVSCDFSRNGDWNDKN